MTDTTPLRAVWHDKHYGIMPPYSILKLYGTDALLPVDFRSLAGIPGVFVPTDGGPVPASSVFSERVRYETGSYPRIVCVPRPQASAAIGWLKQSCRWDPQTLEAAPVSLPGDVAVQMPSGVRFRSYQRRVAELLIAYRRVAVSLPVGSGKTDAAILAGEEAIARGLIDRCVVACPRGQVRSVWERFLWDGWDVLPIVVEGDADRRREAYAAAGVSKSARWIVTAYDTWRIAADRKVLAGLLGPRTLFVADEAHRLKNVRTQRYVSIRRALDSGPNGVTDWRLMMTGTLAHDKAADVYGPVEALGLRAWNLWTEFRDAYFTKEQIRLRDGRIVSRIGRLRKGSEGDLMRVLRGCGIHLTAEECGVELPEVSRQERLVEPTAREAAAAALMAEWVERAQDRDMVLGLLALERSLSSDPGVLRSSESELAARVGSDPRWPSPASPGPKLSALVEWLEDFVSSGDGKAVVFTPFVSLFDVARPLLEAGESELTAASAWYHGRLNPGRADLALHRFLNDPSVRILWSTDAGAEGQNLQGAASYVIHYDQPLSDGTLEQREGRVVRQGQRRPVVIVTFRYSAEAVVSQAAARWAREHVDETVRAILERKSDEKARLRGAAA